VAARGAARGVCSSFIASLSPGQVVPIEVTNNALVSGAGLRFRFDRPALLVAPGTGIAPMRCGALQPVLPPSLSAALAHGVDAQTRACFGWLYTSTWVM
jgi:ferredoxin-NADP reductase